MSKGVLYVVALPIGNTKDITLRAIETLNNVDVIAAEDTRTFNILSKDLSLKTKRVIAHHEHNETESTQGIIEMLNDGKNVALVSDAGTPGINDPGFRLVKQASLAEIKIVPIPGASSLTAALSVAPIGGGTTLFTGFLSSNSAKRKKELESFKDKADRLVMLEAPHRLLEHLQDALTVFGNTEVCVARELTKTYEEIRSGSLTQIIKHFQITPPKGEFVLVYGRPSTPIEDSTQLEQNIIQRLEQGVSPSDIVKELQTQTSLKKKQLYDLVLKLNAKTS